MKPPAGRWFISLPSAGLKSATIIRCLFIVAVVFAAVAPYYATRWLLHHEAVYYDLMDSGRFGRCVAEMAVMIYFLSPIPFALLGFFIGVTIVDVEMLTRRCDSRDAKAPVDPDASTNPTPGVTVD